MLRRKNSSSMILTNSSMFLVINLLRFKPQHIKDSLRNNQKKIENSPKIIFHLKILKNWPMKNIFENDKPIRVWSWFVYKVQVSYQTNYPYLKNTCCIKPEFFVWTKYLEKLLITKYRLSISATLRRLLYSPID